MIVVDQKVQFDVFQDCRPAAGTTPLIVTGTVYGVNYANKVFHVSYFIGSKEMYTSFKFCDIGEKVQVV